MYGALDMALMVAFGYVLVGWAATMMVDRLEGNSIRAGRYVAPTLFFIPALLLVGAVSVAGVQGIPSLVSHVSASVASPKIRTLLGLAGLGASLVVKGVLMYWPAYLVLCRGRVVSALGKSWHCARSWSWLTAMVVLTGWAVKAPLDYLVSQPASLMQNSGPGSVFAALVAGVWVEALGLFYVFGAAASIAVGSSRRE
jgi:hypothetical protein